MVIDPAAILVLLDAIDRRASPPRSTLLPAVGIAKRLGLVEDRHVFDLQNGGTITLTMDELAAMSPVERQRTIGDHKRTWLALTEAGRVALRTRTVEAFTLAA